MEIKIRRNWEFASAHYEGVKIKLRYLTTSELDDCWIIEKGKEKPTFDVDMKKMVSLAVVKIEGLDVVDESGKKESIDTVDKLLNTPGLMDLYYEIYKEVVGSSARVDEKNL
jgi:hypothetical protein